jgi:hypothetical protein
MRRRDFIAGLGGAAAWSVAANAQQRERMRRIGVMLGTLPADDPETQARVTAFVQGLQEFGWTDGRNVRVDYRWGLADADRLRRYAAELVALAPDVVLAGGNLALMASNKPAASCRLCLRMSQTRSAPAMSPVWRDRAPTPPVLWLLNLAKAQN